MTTQIASATSPRKPGQAVVAGTLAAVAFIGGMIVHRSLERPAAGSPADVARPSAGREPSPAAMAGPLTLYLVGSDEEAARMRSLREMITDAEGLPVATAWRVLPVGAAGHATLTDARLQVIDLRAARPRSSASGAGTAALAGVLDQPNVMP